jgi:hypothetical protein
VVLIGIINDMENDNDLQSFYRVQKSKTTNEVYSSTAVEFQTQKIAMNLDYDWMTDAEKTEFFADLFPYNDTMLQYQDFIQIPIA